LIIGYPTLHSNFCGKSVQILKLQISWNRNSNVRSHWGSWTRTTIQQQQRSRWGFVVGSKNIWTSGNTERACYLL